jgi:Elongation Factor G, domain III/Elongation factor G, domain IV
MPMSNNIVDLIEIAIEPKAKGDQEKMGQALARLATEDPSFRVAVDHESGQTIIKGTSEHHLEIIVERMKREFKVEASIGAPQVAYRETITRAVDVDYTYKTQTGGSGQYARVKMRFQPQPPGSGFEFENDVVGGTVPKEYVPGIEKGINGSLDNGVLAGFRDRPEGDPDRRRLSRSRFQRARLRDRGAVDDEGRPRQGRADAARAHHACRGDHARRVCGRRDRRSLETARTHHRPGSAEQGRGHQRDGPTRQYVRI